MEDHKRVYKFYRRPGEDFNLWSARTEAALEAQEVLIVVRDDVVADRTQELDEPTKLKVVKARAIIMQGLDAKPFRVCLADRANPHRMWNRLQERYAVSNIATQVQLQAKLGRLRYDGQAMSDFIDAFEKIFIGIEGMGHAFPEQIQVAMVLASFGEKSKSSFGHIVAALQSAGQNLSWESVTARLLQEYEEQQWNHNSPSVASNSKAGERVLVAARTKHRGSGYQKRHMQETRVCYNCNERGHLSRNCTQRVKEGRRENRLLTWKGDHRGSAQLSRSTLLLTASIGKRSSSKDPELFIMDSGASDHMVHDSSLLLNPRKAATRRIVLGDGRTINATLQGDVHVNTALGGRANGAIRRYVVLKDALYVPGLDVNLISCSRLCDEGFTIRFGKNGCLAMAEDGEVAITACKSKGLYPVQTKVDRSEAHASTAIDEKLWHARLGHANQRSV